jgi:uncharacterized protein YprB with RNaseH-like and TPR domain
MLRNSFCHLPGIGPVYERRLWSLGYDTWDSVLEGMSPGPAGRRFAGLADRLRESRLALDHEDAAFFSDRLPTDEHWRLFLEFRSSTAYLDVETSGAWAGASVITTIALYDGRAVRYYVRGRNLDSFPGDIGKYKLLVTYSGKCFDVPVIEQTFGIRIGAAHIDLRYVLHSLGYTGGLKRCEKQFGIDRGDLDGLDGYWAVLLWDDYVRYGNEHALETLLAYNIEDVVNLETLMVAAYNLKIKGTPFWPSHEQSHPSTPVPPFRAHRETLRRIQLSLR